MMGDYDSELHGGGALGPWKDFSMHFRRTSFGMFSSRTTICDIHRVEVS